jgi:hypothetical protein
MNEKRINQAVEVIDYAINNNISVSEASVKCGYAITYVKNTKALVYEKYDNDTLDDELFSIFDSAYKRYLESRNTGEDNDNGKGSIRGEQIKYTENENEATVEFKAGDNYPVDHIKTLEGLLKACKVNEKIWKVKDYIVNKWDVTSWKEGFPDTIQNFQVKARLERDIRNVRELAIGEMFKDMIKNYTPPISEIVNNRDFIPIRPDENNLFEITLFDLHLGKLAWGGETGENYDTKIARRRFLTTIETLIKRVSGFQYSKIVFPIGSDFYNSDTIFNTTTKGTQQDEDLRWQKTFRVGTKLIVDAINMLKQTGAIKTIVE